MTELHPLLKGRRVAVLQGGNSPERDISLLSAATVCEALTGLGLNWVSVDPLESRWWEKLREGDLIFNILHGGDGEGGVIQGFLETLGYQYTGSDAAGCALAMNKLHAKQLWRGIGLSTAPFTTLHGESDWDALIADWPIGFVKPATGGSSLGMTRVDSGDALQEAWRRASEIDAEVILERFVAGAEYTVGILGDVALPPIRLETDNEFYDYEAKYFSDDTRYLCPCGLDQAQIEELQELALCAFRSLGCEVWGRVDLMLDPDLGFVVLEVNTIPGMTGHSLVPMAASEAGYNIEQLVQQILLLSLDARGDREVADE